MIFNGINNQNVEFRITNYEFPKNTTCQYDSNWLLIYLKVESDCGNWQTIDPSLLTSDVERIIEWFKKMSENRETETELRFLEPNIEFQLTENKLDQKNVRILFDLESRPQSADDNKEYYIDCEFKIDELKSIAIELEKELVPFPTRAK